MPLHDFDSNNKYIRIILYLYRKKARNYTRKNFNDKGNIIIGLREGRERSDTYLKRSSTLLENSKKLNKLTGAHVQIQIIPTWKGGRIKAYSSDGFPKESSSQDITQTAAISTTTPSTPEQPAKSPQKRIATQPNMPNEEPSSSGGDLAAPNPGSSEPARAPAKKKPKQTYDENKCAVCGVEFDSEADQNMSYSYWLNCKYRKKGKGKGKGESSSASCSYWVHTSCIGVYYPRERSGRLALDRWSPSHFFCPKHFPKE